MSNMSNATIRRLIGGIGTALVLLICAVVIGAHFLTGRNLQRIDVSAYTVVKSDGADGYVAELDIDRLIANERLHNPTAAEADEYPEIEALKGLSIRMTPKGDGYELETVTSAQDPTALLKKHGIRLVNTRWTLTKAELNVEEPGEQQTVVFTLPAHNLAFVGADGLWRLEEGDFVLRVENLTQKIHCTQTKVWDTPNR